MAGQVCAAAAASKLVEKNKTLRAVMLFASPAGFWVSVGAQRLPVQSYGVHVERRA